MQKTEKKVGKAKKIYNVVSTILVSLIFVFLVVVVGLTFWQRQKGSDSSLFGYYVFDVLTDSMSGTIEEREVIISKKVNNPNELKEGDIITFIAPSGPLKGYNETHRIVSVERNEDGTVKFFKTKGDNPSVGIDNWELAPSAVKAKFVKKSPFIAGFRDFISKPYGYVVLVALPILIAGTLLIVGFVRDKTKKIAEEEAESGSGLDGMSEEEKARLAEEILLADLSAKKITAEEAVPKNDEEVIAGKSEESPEKSE